MDHHKSPLIECKLEKYTMYVSIHHENKACTTHTQHTHKHTRLAHAHSLNMQALFYVHVFVCVHASVYVVSRQAAEIYGLHSG